MVVICKYCNKEYSSYASRSNHIKKFHNTDSNLLVIQTDNISNPKVIQESSKNPQKIFSCIKCNTIFKYKQGKWKHEQKCNVHNISKQTETELLKKQNKELKDQMKEKDKNLEEFKKQILDLITPFNI